MPCRALCGQLPDGQLKELVIVIPLQLSSKWGNYRFPYPSSSSPSLPAGRVNSSAAKIIYNAGWKCLCHDERLASTFASGHKWVVPGGGGWDAKANLCWRSLFGGVRQCVSTINLKTTRFLSLNSNWELGLGCQELHLRVLPDRLNDAGSTPSRPFSCFLMRWACRLDCHSDSSVNGVGSIKLAHSFSSGSGSGSSQVSGIGFNCWNSPPASFSPWAVDVVAFVIIFRECPGSGPAQVS